jgi:tetratricopeptide (TPR) repeat protein
MPSSYTCSRGHRWEAADADSSLLATPMLCPLCGTVGSPANDREVATEPTRTKDDDPFATKPPTPVPPADSWATRPPPDAPPFTSWATRAPIPAGSGPRLWPTIPGYEILGELGRGAMGVVYQARQGGLNRIVALKMILAGSHAGPNELARFRTEAQAVARLGHPHIVHVYDVGEHEGKPFFSLEYCPGGGLDKKLKGTPLLPREEARLVETLARAMAAAHEKPVIHRDLKPANVLLTEDGTPKVSDFGLAKKLDEAGPSLTGDVMGTPSYMAPEQARGDSKQGPAADVYALGAILYETLVGRPPFKAATVRETLNQVVSDDPVSPRLLQPKTPRDLETVCLKCLRKDPAKRYAAAEALAEDLRRFQANEPILARPVGWGERAAKWVRRRPVIAALLLTIGLLTATAAVIILAYNTKLAGERNAANAQRDEAKAFLALTRRAVDDYTTRVSQDPRMRERGLEDLRKELLQTAVAYYEEIARRRGDDPEIQEERGKAYVRLADITADIGALADAIPLYEQALDIFTRLVQSHPDVPSHRRVLATTHNKLALTYRHTDQPVRADAAFRLAVEQNESLAVAAGAPPDDEQSLVGVLGNLGNFYRDTGRTDEAERFFERALAIVERLEGEHADRPTFKRDLAATCRHLALALYATGRTKRAEELFKKALGIEEELVKAYEKEEDFQLHLAATLNNLAIIYTDTGRPGKAEEAYGWAVGLRDRLARAHPLVTSYRRELGQLHNNLGTLYTDTGRPEKAVEAFLEALKQRTRLVDLDPTVMEYQHDLAGTYSNLGFLYGRLGRPDDADKAFRGAELARATIAKANVSRPEYESERATLLNNRSNFYAETGQADKAEKALREAIAIWEKLTREQPSITVYQAELAKSYNNLAGVLDSVGDRDGAEQTYKDALAIRKRLAKEHPTVVEFQTLLATAHNNLGTVYHMKGQFENALAAYRKSLDLYEGLSRHQPTVLVNRVRLAKGYNNLGGLFGAADRYPEAEEAFRKALDVCKDLARDFPDQPENKPLLARIHNGLAVTFQRTERPGPAEMEYLESVRLMEELTSAEPASVDYAASLGLNRGNMGDIARDPRKPETALGWYARSIDGLADLLKRQPRYATVRDYLCKSHAKRAEFLADLKRHKEAVPDWERAIELADEGPKAELRYNAACSAALAASGKGKDAEKLSDVERAELRNQALKWLRASLVAWANQLDKDAHKVRPMVQNDLAHWQQDTDLTGVRDAAALEKLPVEERDAWRKLWEDVGALLKKTQAKK